MRRENLNKPHGRVVFFPGINEDNREKYSPSLTSETLFRNNNPFYLKIMRGFSKGKEEGGKASYASHYHLIIWTSLTKIKESFVEIPGTPRLLLWVSPWNFSLPQYV